MKVSKRKFETFLHDEITKNDRLSPDQIRKVISNINKRCRKDSTRHAFIKGYIWALTPIKIL